MMFKFKVHKTGQQSDIGDPGLILNFNSKLHFASSNSKSDRYSKDDLSLFSVHFKLLIPLLRQSLHCHACIFGTTM